MSEDVSEVARLSVTVTLMAAAISMVLNIMVMSYNILDRVQTEYDLSIKSDELYEYEGYNNTKISGAMVKATISVYAKHDLGFVVRNQACLKKTGGAPEWGYNYGALLKNSGTSGSAKIVTSKLPTHEEGGHRIGELLTNSNGLVLNKTYNGMNSSTNTQFVLDSALFTSEIIRNNTGDLVGFIFEQIS